MPTRVVVSRLSAAMLGLLAVVGCEPDRTTIFDFIAPASYEFRFALGVRGLPGGSVATSVISGDSAVVVTLRGLKPLSGAFYRVWVTDSTAGTLTAGQGRWIRTRTDTSATGVVTVTVDTTSAAGPIALRGGGPRVSYSVQILKSSMGTNPRTAFHQVALTIQTDSAGAAGTVRPLWKRYRAPGATGALSLGNFTTGYVFVAAGTGSASMRGPELVGELNNVARAPIGYQYRVWLRGVAGDTTAAGGFTGFAPAYNSLDDSDASQSPDTVITPLGLRFARFRACVGGCNGGVTLTLADSAGAFWFKDTDSVAVSLEPKSGAAGRGPTAIMAAAASDIARRPTQ